MTAGCDCTLCLTPGGDLLWQDDRLRVVAVSDPDYPGFCRVIWSAHNAEMSDLTQADQQHLMSTVFRVESALRDLLSPTKINLASLGNVVPHLHWHVIPRFSDDRHFPASVWAAPARDPVTRHLPDDFGLQLAARLAEELHP